MAQSVQETKIPKDLQDLYECAESMWEISEFNAKETLISLSNTIKSKTVTAEFVLNTLDHIAEYNQSLVPHLAEIYYNISISFKKLTDVQCAQLDKALFDKGLVLPNQYVKYNKSKIKKSAIVKTIINGDIDKFKEMAQETVLKPSYVNLAVRRHHNEIAEILIKDYLSEFEDNLLYDCIRSANFQIAIYLVEHQINNTDYRALEAACRTGSINLVKYLIKNGCKVNQQNIEDEIHYQFMKLIFNS
ncbi:hypothetical protein TVAG_464530 [Trichomonas vaginalis G3]|uniref:Uncharacterized protein n=1 Tax=Trichomonas vaginalis (strain ATCC PRA-98 / G3) TaxID=412133 RepID=A2EEJ8_TRIV3|nr:Ankyrin repeat family [Trichomonas vaginalis G3]EAY08905.1 hypothetical protein TVAG_464530 [Trichomonas vaginalis G3]KAI5494381.1 Ankyrin repeat family [Trichomonas vaginalis G3]|eukprot:XP_001321128.1 hypothetical protein [Trichomonas vaginalis G3]